MRGKSLEIFISYAMADSKRLHVADLASDLAKKSEIHKVHYWEGWAGYPDGDIIEFMESNIKNATFFLPICTAASERSENCEKERKMAIHQNIPSIPLYEDFKYVSPALQISKGIQIRDKDILQIVDEVYAQLTAMMKSPAKRSRFPLKAISIAEQEKAELLTKYKYFQDLGRQHEKERRYQDAFLAYQEALKRSQELYDSKAALDMKKRIARVKGRIEKQKMDADQFLIKIDVENIISEAKEALKKGDSGKAISLFEEGAKKALSVFDLKTHDRCKKAAAKARAGDLLGLLK